MKSFDFDTVTVAWRTICTIFTPVLIFLHFLVLIILLKTLCTHARAASHTHSRIHSSLFFCSLKRTLLFALQYNSRSPRCTKQRFCTEKNVSGRRSRYCCWSQHQFISIAERAPVPRRTLARYNNNDLLKINTTIEPTDWILLDHPRKNPIAPRYYRQTISTCLISSQSTERHAPARVKQ